MISFLLVQATRVVGRPAARARIVVTAAADRPLWAPGVQPPSYLNGSLPGDRGFDPMGLGADPKALAWYRQAELVHARWAMLGVAGVLVQGRNRKLSRIWYRR